VAVDRGSEGDMKVRDFHVIVVQRCLSECMGCECMTNIATWYDSLVDLSMLSSQRGYSPTCYSNSLSPLFWAANTSRQGSLITTQDCLYTWRGCDNDESVSFTQL
jgi:hypothetical protein